MQLAQDQLEAAERSFADALSHQPRTTAALAGLGRTALARRDHAKAVKYLEDALTLDPQAATLHYSLAMAYRGLGEREKAEAHLRQRGTAELLLPDPLMQELSVILRSAASYESLGIRALEHGEAASATTFFRKGLELAPDSASLHHRLGTALFMTGDARGAMDQFEAALRLSPDFAKAHYSIGVLLASTGRDRAALERFSAAVKYDPGYVEARLLLADMLRHLDRPDQASRHYEQIVAANPRVPEAWLGSAMILVRAGRYQQARDRLTEALKADPDEPELSNALARLLAAAPDDRVRDGSRAIEMMQPLVTRHPTAEMLETMAMARAEVGDYDQAVAWQRKAMDEAVQAGRDAHSRQQMAANLELFERRAPSRIPWREGTMP
jgi:tetratricopeptide (TPR) repeat protein